MYIPTRKSLAWGALLLGLTLLIMGHAHAQPKDSCLLGGDYFTLNIDAFESNLAPGNRFFINDFVLDEGATGIARGDLKTPLFSYFQYRRPATPKEIKKKAVKGNPDAYVFEDGNVYLLRSDQECWGLFLVDTSFSGTFHRLEDGHIPPGMVPINPYDLIGTPLALEAWKEDYKSFHCPLGTVVFYDGFYQANRLFDSERTQKEYEAKKDAGRSLLGRSLLVVASDSNMQFTPSIIGAGVIYPKKIDTLDLEVKDIYIGKSCSVIDFGDKDQFLLWDAGSIFELYDKGCVENRKRKEAAARQRVLEEQKREQERIIREQAILAAKIKLILEEGITDENLEEDRTYWEELKGSFALESDLRGINYWKHHLTESDEALSVNVLLSEDGNIHMRTSYMGDEWLFHEHLEFSIFDQKHPSSVVEPYSRNSHFTRYGTRVEESISLRDRQDIKVLKEVALQVEDEILVTFIGRKKDKTLTLSTTQKEVIRDTYLYWMYLNL